MINATINNRELQVPENWEDILKNRALLLFTVSLFFLKLTKQEILNLFVFKVLKINSFKRTRINRIIEKQPSSDNAWHICSQIAMASEQFNFIVDNPLEIKENYFPHLFRHRKLYGTDYILSNSEIWEFALCEADFFDYAKTQDVKFLDALIYKLYRPKKFFYGIRKYFNDFEEEIRSNFSETKAKKRLKRISKLPIHYKWLIYRWFAYQRELIIKAHPFTYKEKSGSGDGGTWADTIIAMSEVGQEERTSKIKLSVFLRRIDNENKEAEKLKNKSKQK